LREKGDTMPTITVPRSTSRSKRSATSFAKQSWSRYQITPSVTGKGFFKEVQVMAKRMLVKGNRLEPGQTSGSIRRYSTEIQVVLALPTRDCSDSSTESEWLQGAGTYWRSHRLAGPN